MFKIYDEPESPNEGVCLRCFLSVFLPSFHSSSFVLSFKVQCVLLSFCLFRSFVLLSCLFLLCCFFSSSLIPYFRYFFRYFFRSSCLYSFPFFPSAVPSCSFFLYDVSFPLSFLKPIIKTRKKKTDIL